ncbi:MAG: flagellar basal body rod protein FlgC [Pseudomonadales bacterium]|jgi:flagellar basal-body rod protein FlgC
MALGKIFDAAGSAMAAQALRLNTVASNLANVNTVSSTAEGVYQPKQAVFEAVLAERSGGIDGVRVASIGRSNIAPVPRYAPDHPLADDQGYIYESGVNVVEEMANMTDASRTYQTNIELVSTAKRLMLATLRLGQ